ncbi:MAG: amino acid carrier protein [Nannocystaceae bacterium]|nr:amino acid carrier protein [Nannocystaceae bacterium]
MESLRSAIERLDQWVWKSGIEAGGETIPFLVLALLGTGAFLTLRLGFVQLRRFGHGVRVASGRYDDPDHPGDVSHFQALSTALSATVGIGNIAGVAIAIHWGGPGALFWMWMTALVGMATKYAEVVLALRYRDLGRERAGAQGTVAGGPMYAIARGLPTRLQPLAYVFAIMLGTTAMLTGNGVQANTIADTFATTLALPHWAIGLGTAAIVAAVVLGGIGRIARVSSVLAPAMAILYVVAGVTVLVLHADRVGPALALVVQEAFSPTAGVAGTGAGALVVTMMWGVRRGLFSNEAGQGSAPIAHAAARTDEPCSEGSVALLEPFIDTIVICTITALVVIVTGAWHARTPTELQLGGGDLSWVQRDEHGAPHRAEPPSQLHVDQGVVEGEVELAWHDAPVDRVFVDAALAHPFSGTIEPATRRALDRDGAPVVLYGDAAESGAPLTMMAFRRGLAPIADFGHHLVLLSVLLFGISTAISWCYYGERCALFVLGPKVVQPYRAVYVGMHFVGAVLPLPVAWTLGDAMLGVAMLPNLLALWLLSGQVAALTRSYFARRPWLAIARARGAVGPEARP